MKRCVTLFISMSLDGYIARNDGSIDWLTGDTEIEDPTYDNFYKTIDTVLMGRSTYDQIVNELAVNNYPYKDCISYVFTHDNTISSDETIKFVKDAPSSIVSEIIQKDGQGIWIVGGASIIAPLISENVIDRYIIAVIPKLLGDGISLFRPGFNEINLKLITSYSKNDIVHLHYEKKK